MKQLAVISTHPVQYNAPLFRELHNSRRISIHVFYTQGNYKEKYDKEFGKAFAWDIPLLEDYPYTFVPNKGRNSGFFRAVNPGLNAAVKRYNPDALLVFGWDLYSHFRLMQHFKGQVPVLFRGDSTLLDEVPGIRIMLRRALLTYVYRFIDFALFTGKANKKYFLRHGVPRKKLVFAPHAIDNSRFGRNRAYRESRALNWRLSLGIPQEAIVVVFAGKFIPKKQPELLIRAARSQALPHVHYVLAGSGVLEENLRKEAPENVHFVPFQNQSSMPLLYTLGDMFVLPSKGPGETWGLAVNEAMACGRPVLLSNKAGAAYDLILPGKNGYTFNPFDFPDFEAKLLRMLDKEKLQQMGRYAWNFIQEWNYNRVVKGIERCLFAD